MFRSKKSEETPPVPPSGPSLTNAPTAHQADAFLGTLRSEFDEPEIVPEGFVRLAEDASMAVEAYKAGRITKKDLAERLSKLRATDVSGGEWTVGATSLRWFRRQGGAGMWVPVPPPSQAIGEPMPGEWMRTLPLPDEVLTEAPESTEVAVDLVKETPMVPSEPITYADTFDAGLAKLLEEDTSPEAPTEVAGPMPRIMPRGEQTKGPIARSGGDTDDEGVPDENVVSDELLYEPPTSESLTVETDDDLFADYLGGSIPSPAPPVDDEPDYLAGTDYMPADASPYGDLDNDATVDPDSAQVEPETDIPAPDATGDHAGVLSDEPGGDDDLFLPPEMFWSDDKD